ncbi:MAG: helical backbone metal receptor [Campylobacterota bacterium]|nr:helical backbone metal receptor [Campylobacterota bacterium]
MSRLIFLLLFSLPLFSQERIVTLNPAVADIVAALDETENIVAVSDYTLYPEVLVSRPKVGGYTTLSIEKVLSHRPTLVIGLEHQQKFLSQLQAFHIRTEMVRLERIEDIKKSILSLAALLHHEEKGEALIAEIEMSKKSAPKLPVPQSVLIVFANASSLSRGVYVAGHDLFFEEIIQACGASNAYTSDYSLQPVLNVEGIIATNPDHVLLLSGPLDRVNLEKLLQRWQALPIKAAKNNQIKVIRNDYILIPSQRIAESIRTVCEAIQ